jgi:Protein of Unknown function (DUF2784)
VLGPIYRILAGAVVGVHLAFVLFVALGGLLVWRWPRLRWAHLPAVAWGVWIELSDSICPLTPLENDLRRAAGVAGYRGGFIEHYLLPVLYPEGLTRAVQLTLAGGVLLLNVVIYWRLIHRSRAAGRT